MEGDEGRPIRRSVALRARAPYPVAPLLDFLGARAIPAVEELAGSTFRRSVPTSFGPAVIALKPRPDGGVGLDVAADSDETVAPAVQAARRLFDLDADPDAIGRALRRDPELRPLAKAHPGIRVPGAADGFELVVRAILGQQVSVAAARTMLGRVVAAFADPGLRIDALVPFPGPDRLVDAPLEELGITRRRGATIRRVAASVASGDIDLSGRADVDETAEALLALDGIGPWTVEYVRMRALGDHDAFPAGDLGIRRAFVGLGLDDAPRSVAARAETWRPWRAYAAMLLWQVPASPAARTRGSR